LSEAEVHILRQRMYQGQLNKAKRGELFNRLPIGYIRLPSGEPALDPDEQVQAVVRWIFDQFDELGSINAVLRYLVRHEVRMPVRPHSGPERGQLQWRRPNRQTLRNLLQHPIYGGAYTWGRRPVDPRCKVPGRPSTGRKVAPPEECKVFLKDRCPAYITWERYQSNRRRIADNQARIESRGAVREGSALLQGLLVCGRCGCRMVVGYDRLQKSREADPSRPRYVCERRAVEYGESLCQSVAGAVLDEFAALQVLSVLEPAALELSLSAAEDIHRQRTTIDKHWRQRLERARYDTDRARRQYHAVEPENRLVARELERQWEQRIQEQCQLEEQYDRIRQDQPAALSDADRDLVRSLSRDIPKLWHGRETTSADRRIIVRHLIQEVIVTAPRDSQRVDLDIQWAGGFTSHSRLTRPVARYDQLDNFDQLLERILELQGQRQTAAKIAEKLNHEGFRPPQCRKTFSGAIVRALLTRHGKMGKRPSFMEEYNLAIDEWWLTDLARHLELAQPTLYKWLRRGWVHARQLPVTGGRWIVWADAEELDRLQKLRRCPRNRYNQAQAPELTTPKPRPGL
jgi:hypothetical protein